MKKALFSLFLGCLSFSVYAAQTTYTFTAKDWSSKVGLVQTDGKTDGWVSRKDGQSFQTGYETPQGIASRGIQVTEKGSGAAAESVITFTEVRKLTVNYCTNNKAGKGSIVVRIGENDSIVSNIETPTGNGSLNRETEIALPAPQTGKICIKINCTENSIYIHQLTIKATNASPSVDGISKTAFQLVTNTNQLNDGDEVMIGVSAASQNYAMGVFSDAVSRNNIHALRATYSADRNTMNEIADAVYTLHTETDAEGKVSYLLQDYTGWYIVASGGNPSKGNNNYLTAWDLADSPSYGRFGYWTIRISEDGTATLLNQGSSRSNLLQFNYNGGTPIFACYATPSQTGVAIYRRISLPADDEPYIQPAFVNFGTALLTQETVSGSTTTKINAINLTEDIRVSLKGGSTFTLDKSLLDRDGERLTISYQASETGIYRDTILLQSGSTKAEVPILLRVEQLLTIAQACQLEDQAACWLGEVVVTKKYDKYIFIEDGTGSMLLFDGSNLYGKDIKNGYRLQGVTGKIQNYYGNPSMNLSRSFTSKKGETCPPAEISTALSEEDACRYVVIRNTTFTEDGKCLVGDTPTPLYALFGALPSVTAGTHYDVVAIAYNYNGMVLCPVSVTETGTAVTDATLPDDFRREEGILLNPRGVRLSVYSTSGTLLCTTDRDLDTNHWNEGIYIVRAETEETFKLIIP